MPMHGPFPPAFCDAALDQLIVCPPSSPARALTSTQLPACQGARRMPSCAGTPPPARPLQERCMHEPQQRGAGAKVRQCQDKCTLATALPPGRVPHPPSAPCTCQARRPTHPPSPAPSSQAVPPTHPLPRAPPRLGDLPTHPLQRLPPRLDRLSTHPLQLLPPRACSEWASQTCPTRPHASCASRPTRSAACMECREQQVGQGGLHVCQ